MNVSKKKNDDIKHDMILMKIHRWLVMASANDELTNKLFCEYLEVKGVIDKLYKNTTTEMTMHSYYTSGLKLVTHVNSITAQKKIYDDA